MHLCHAVVDVRPIAHVYCERETSCVLHGSPLSDCACASAEAFICAIISGGMPSKRESVPIVRSMYLSKSCLHSAFDAFGPPAPFAAGGSFGSFAVAVAVATPFAPGLPFAAGVGIGVIVFALPSPVIDVVSGCDGSVLSTGFGFTAAPFRRSSEAEFAGTPSSFVATIFAGGPPHAASETVSEVVKPKSPTQRVKRSTTEA